MDYGSSLQEDKVIHSLSDVLFPTYITIDMQKVPKRVVKDRLENAHANNERVISQERTRNYNNKQFGAPTSYNLQTKRIIWKVIWISSARMMRREYM